MAAHAARLKADEDEAAGRRLDPEAFASNAIAAHHASTSMEERIKGNRFYTQKGADSGNFLKKR